MKPENLQKIKDSFDSIYLFKSEDVEELMLKFETLPDESLGEIEAILQQAMTFQAEFIRKNVEKDPSFVNNLGQLLNANYKEISIQVTNNDQKSADQILDNL